MRPDAIEDAAEPPLWAGAVPHSGKSGGKNDYVRAGKVPVRLPQGTNAGQLHTQGIVRTKDTLASNTFVNVCLSGAAHNTSQDLFLSQRKVLPTLRLVLRQVLRPVAARVVQHVILEVLLHR